MSKFHAFLSYASEDSVLASEIAGGLKSRGIKVWYAPIHLKVGDKLLDTLEQGMRDSTFGILLISKAYLEKPWPNYEMDTLIRQSIEQGKKLLPIWHQVSKEEVEARHTGLSGIVPIRSEFGLHNVIDKLTEVLASNAPTIGVIPTYESPKYRFLDGVGEIKLGTAEGPATTLWEALLYLKNDEYPISLEGELFSKEDLLFRAAQILAADPNRAIQWVQNEGKEKIWSICVAAGFDPNIFE